MRKRIAPFLIVILFVLCSCGMTGSKEEKLSDDIIVLYTGNICCGVDNGITYAGVSACKKELEEKYKYVMLVDSGNFLSGKLIGTLSGGGYPIEIMNKAGYDIVALGKKEFYYNVSHVSGFKGLFDFSMLSCNLFDCDTGESVFLGYDIKKCDNKSIAFVGVTEPSTCNVNTKQKYYDENGNQKYDFCQDEVGKKLCSKVQETVDTARENGADYVIVLSNLSERLVDNECNVTKLIKNTKGIDVVLNGNGDDVIECNEIKNIDGDEVILSDAGTNLDNIGKLSIGDDKIDVEMISEYEKKDLSVSNYMVEKLHKYTEVEKNVVVNTTIPLICKDGDSYIIRYKETNLGDLCADAYRNIMGADIGLVDAGAIGEGIDDEDITYEDISKIFPYSQQACLIRASGRQVVSALEMGAVDCPMPNRDFLQVSGLKYEIDIAKKSPITADAKAPYDSNIEDYRVQNVMVMNSQTGEYEPIDLDKEYTVALSNYMCKGISDSFSAFEKCERILDNELSDSELLLKYLEPLWGSNIADKYFNKDGDGRISIIAE